MLALAVLASISMLFMGCPKGTDTPAEPTSDPATNVEKPAEETPIATFKITSKDVSWAITGNAIVDLPKFSVEADATYVIKGKAKISKSADGKVKSLAFQETKSWSGFNTLKEDATEGLDGKTFEFEAEWTAKASAAGDHEKLQFALMWDAAADGTECTVDLYSISITKK